VAPGNQYAPGFTALHWAAYLGCCDLVRLLVDKGAHMNAKDLRGQTPLHVACAWAQGASSELLVELGASCEIVDNHGLTPGDIAEEAYIKYHFPSMRPQDWWGTPFDTFPGPGAWMECANRVKWAEEDRAVRNRKRLEMLAAGAVEGSKRSLDPTDAHMRAPKRQRPDMRTTNF
jgi:hypothetical protein